jgi:hypothetical protein
MSRQLNSVFNLFDSPVKSKINWLKLFPLFTFLFYNYYVQTSLFNLISPCHWTVGMTEWNWKQLACSNLSLFSALFFWSKSCVLGRGGGGGSAWICWLKWPLPPPLLQQFGRGREAGALVRWGGIKEAAPADCPPTRAAAPGAGNCSPYNELN